MVHDADHRHAVVLLTHGERQPAAYCVHPVIGQLNLWLAYGNGRQADVNTAHCGAQLCTGTHKYKCSLAVQLDVERPSSRLLRCRTNPLKSKLSPRVSNFAENTAHYFHFVIFSSQNVCQTVPNVNSASESINIKRSLLEFFCFKCKCEHNCCSKTQAAIVSSPLQPRQTPTTGWSNPCSRKHLFIYLPSSSQLESLTPLWTPSGNMWGQAGQRETPPHIS